ncbi:MULTISPECIES: hypothetical protein [Sphingobacterium]|uniref:hypothetical protein n=1 Tax=Sphingobacterium TaxID=28453 RepID=UPI0025917D18|nr:MULTISPECIES: hypothetical protein [Sphingobacterium]
MKDQYKQLLDLFVLKEENDKYNQIWQRSPFTFDFKTAATNGRSVVIIPGKFKGRSYQFQDGSKYMLEIKDYSKNLWIDIPVAWLIKSIGLIPMISSSCPECGGSGKGIWEYQNGNQYYERIDDCPACDGYSVRDRFDNIFDGKVYSMDEGVKIGNHIFRGNNLIELVKAAEVLEVDVITMISQTKKHDKTVFKIGNVEVFSMPFSSEIKATAVADFGQYLLNEMKEEK